MFFYSPHYFLSLFVTAIFSVLFGIVLKVLMIDCGFVAAFALWGVAFAFDYISTVTIPNYTSHETNQLFHLFAKYTSNGMAFLLIGVIALIIQCIVFWIYSDLIITYIITVACFCTVLSNVHIRKNLLKYNSHM